MKKRDRDKIIKCAWEMNLELFANLFLPFLIWAGAVLAFLNGDEPVLAFFLWLAGVAKVYLLIKESNKEIKSKKKIKNEKHRQK